jgi:hypothetical protein
VQSENISICIWTVLERRNEVLQRVARVVCKLRKQSLRFRFGKRAHDRVVLFEVRWLYRGFWSVSSAWFPSRAFHVLYYSKSIDCFVFFVVVETFQLFFGGEVFPEPQLFFLAAACGNYFNCNLDFSATLTILQWQEYQRLRGVGLHRL